MGATQTFLVDVTVAIAAAALGGAIARALRVAPVLGYVVAGVVIGRFLPGYLAGGAAIGGLGELGLILLLFSLGLGFSPRELQRAGFVPLAGNLVVMALLGAVAWSVASGLRFPHPVTLALAFTLSSTAVGAALLQTFGLREHRVGHVAVAVLIAQDLIAVAILVVTSTPAGELTAAGIIVPLLKAILFVVIALILGATVLHRLVVTVLRRAPADSLIAVFCALALIAAWLGHAAGLSFEFGAFVAGAVTSEAAGSRTVQAIVAPFRELFVMLFFVAIGTLVDLRTVAAHWPAVLVLALAALVARAIGWSALARFSGMVVGTVGAFAVALLPLGEFNVVLASDSYRAGRLNAPEFSSLVGATFVSIAVAAIAARVVAPRRLHAGGAREVEPFAQAPEVLILGYGRVGRMAANVLRRAGVQYGVVESDRERVTRARDDGANATYGDGADPRVVETLLSPQTKVVLATIPDSSINAAIARRLGGSRRVIARATRVDDLLLLQDAGAAAALVPEAEGAFGFAEAVLNELGLQPAQSEALVAAQRAELARSRRRSRP